MFRGVIGKTAIMLLLATIIATVSFPTPRSVMIGLGRGESFIDLMPLHYWVAALDSPDVATRREAAHKIGHLGAAAQSALPRMIRMMSEYDGKFGAEISNSQDARWGLADPIGRVLVGMGDRSHEHLPNLLRLLASPDRTTRYYTLKVFEHLGPLARAALPAIEQCMRDEWPFVRSTAAAAMTRIDREATIRALIETLQDRAAGVRSSAVENLGRLGAAAAQALPAIEKLLDKEPDYYCRQAARNALLNIQLAIVNEQRRRD